MKGGKRRQRQPREDLRKVQHIASQLGAEGAEPRLAPRGQQNDAQENLQGVPSVCALVLSAAATEHACLATNERMQVS